MSRKYRIGYASRHRARKLFVVVCVSLLVCAGIGGFLFWDMSQSGPSGHVEGASQSVEQVADVGSGPTLNVNEPFFAMQVPANWKEVERRNVPTDRSITWAPRANKTAVGHSLKVYIDTTPKDFAINKLLPLDASTNMLTYRQMSDNCKSFTTPGSKTSNLPQPSKWQGIDFMCDLPSFAQNKVGTGTAGAVNATAVTGPTKGTHRYFFVYTDHNYQPDYQLFYNVLKSFQAK
jgi:hypothetical protein